MVEQFRSDENNMQRRDFLTRSAAGAAIVIGAEPLLSAAQGADKTASAGLREKLLHCLGGAWPDPCDLRPKLRETIRKDGYRIESVTYEAEANDPIPAYLLVPDGVDAAHPASAVAVWHQHNGQWQLGKVEPAGLAGMPMHHTGVALVKEGYVVLCPDALCFGERQNANLKGGDYERFEFLRYVVGGKCMAWKNILDMRRAVDYLCSRPDVQKDRIGCYGHSMGSTFTWLVGPWEPRLKCLVGNCCLPDLQGHPSDAHPALLPELHSGVVPVRGYARHRCLDRAPCPAPEPWRNGWRQPDPGGA